MWSIPMIEVTTVREIPASRAAAPRVSIARPNHCVASVASRVGGLTQSMITSAPASAAGRPCPVMMSMPVDRAISRTSCPSARAFSTTLAPSVPVAPTTAMTCAIADSSLCGAAGDLTR